MVGTAATTTTNMIHEMCECLVFILSRVYITYRFLLYVRISMGLYRMWSRCGRRTCTTWPRGKGGNQNACFRPPPSPVGTYAPYDQITYFPHLSMIPIPIFYRLYTICPEIESLSMPRSYFPPSFSFLPSLPFPPFPFLPPPAGPPRAVRSPPAPRLFPSPCAPPHTTISPPSVDEPLTN